MIFSSQQIETITQSVLQELRSRGVAIAAADAGSTHSFNGKPQATASDTKADACGLPLNAKVITEDSLLAAGVSGKTISIPAGAVITPSGHDFIRRNNVSITNGGVNTPATSGGLLIVIGDCSAAASAASSAKWRATKAGCEVDAANKTTKHMPRPVVCIGGEPSVTACLLNRTKEIRAAVIATDTDLHQLSTAMNPQVVCLNSVGWTFAAVLKLLRQLNGSNAAAPSKWKELR